ITPSVQVPPFAAEMRYPRRINGETMSDYLEWMTLPSIITTTNHPAVSVPIGFTASGLPVGIQIIGRFRSESRLLEIGKRIEDRIGPWATTPRIETPMQTDRCPHTSRLKDLTGSLPMKAQCQTLIIGARVVDPRNGVDDVLTIGIADGRIVHVGPETIPAERS